MFSYVAGIAAREAEDVPFQRERGLPTETFDKAFNYLRLRKKAKERVIQASRIQLLRHQQEVHLLYSRGDFHRHIVGEAGRPYHVYRHMAQHMEEQAQKTNLGRRVQEEYHIGADRLRSLR